MGYRNTLVNVLSFGAHSRVKKRVEQYEGIQSQVQQAYEALERTRVAANRTLEDLVVAKTAGIKELKKLSRISKNLDTREREVTEHRLGQTEFDEPVARIEETVSAAEFAMNSARGATAGISTAMGTWALVGTYGTASTGTAISGLGGAAATNATLAWLGGGSLASGGLGMAGGTAVLGGIVLLPAVVILGVLSHLSANRKINAIVEATSTALAAIARYRELTLALEAVDRRASEVSGSIRKVNATFEVQFRATYRAVFRFGFVSRAVRWVRQQLFGGKYFNESDLRQISALLDMAVGLAKLIDVPIMDEFGGLR